MRRGPLAVLAAAAVLLGAALFLLNPGAPQRVEIPERLSARQTAELLGEKRVVFSVKAFRAYLKLTRADRHLKPGAYTLREHEWFPVIARKLTQGLTDDVKVTIPEGWRASQIAARLGEAGIADPKDFLAYVRLKKWEGRLFPSTYRFPPGYGADRAAEKMHEEFERQIGAAYAGASPKPALSLEDALIIASIVEREAVQPQERAVIAAVYLNRVKKRMPLQADPTVQYALGAWKKGLTRDDLKVPSAYNTYLRQGLPPTPICSPRLESFEAVLHPANTAALYFVADGKGGHVFSETNEEHSEARRLYKHELRRQKEKLKKQAQQKDASAPAAR